MVSEDGITALMLCSKYGFSDEAEKLEPTYAGKQSKEGVTALMMAAKANNLTLIKLLS